jgi:hypothetical protein
VAGTGSLARSVQEALYPGSQVRGGRQQGRSGVGCPPGGEAYVTVRGAVIGGFRFLVVSRDPSLLGDPYRAYSVSIPRGYSVSVPCSSGLTACRGPVAVAYSVSGPCRPCSTSLRLCRKMGGGGVRAHA